MVDREPERMRERGETRSRMKEKTWERGGEGRMSYDKSMAEKEREHREVRQAKKVMEDRDREETPE